MRKIGVIHIVNMKKRREREKKRNDGLAMIDNWTRSWIEYKN
jgi:hypothetical protein